MPYGTTGPGERTILRAAARNQGIRDLDDDGPVVEIRQHPGEIAEGTQVDLKSVGRMRPRLLQRQRKERGAVLEPPIGVVVPAPVRESGRQQPPLS